MERLGLSVHDKDSMEVKLFDYISEDGDIKGLEKKIAKVCRNFRI